MKKLLICVCLLFAFHVKAQMPSQTLSRTNAQSANYFQSLKNVRSALEGNWKNDRRFKGKLWITTFKFTTDSTGSWSNNRTHSTAPIFILREKNGSYYISAIDVIGGECAPREIRVLNSKKLVLLDPVTQEKFTYKRLRRR